MSKFTPRNLDKLQANVARETERAAADPLYFIDTYCVTFDPRSENKDLPFELYDFQRDYVMKIWETIKSGRKEDIFTEKSRDMGVTWLTLGAMLHLWLFYAGFQFKLGTRKEDEVDNWEMDTLFPKLEYLLMRSPFRPKGFDLKKHRTFMKMVNPENDNLFVGESANPHFSRSGRYNAILFDEIAFWPWAQSSWESAGESTPCRIGVTTPSETPSYAKQLRNSGKPTLITLHWRLHPKKTQEWYEAEKKRKTSDELAREVDINWEGSTKGIVYPEISQAEVGKFPFIANQPIYTGWDFGLDGTRVQWWQLNPDNGKWRLIDSFAADDKVIQFFFPLFGSPIDSKFSYDEQDIKFIQEISKLPKPTHFGDPNVQQRNIQTGTPTRDLLEAVGIYVNTDTKKNDLETRKTDTKLLLQNGIEVNDTPRNHYWLDSLRNARYPQRQEGSQSVSANIKPVHDWTSHHRTATEYFAVNRPMPRKPTKRRERRYDPITGRLLS